MILSLFVTQAEHCAGPEVGEVSFRRRSMLCVLNVWTCKFLWHKSVPQECPARVSHERVSYKSAPQKCPPKVSCKDVPQVFPTSTRVSHKSVRQEGCVSWCSGGTAPGLKRES